MTDPPRSIVIVNAYPLLSQAQGDEGNALVLAHRARLRGIVADVITHHDRGPLPRADAYVIGGMEESTLPELAARLRAGGLTDAVANGAAVLAVDAGLQVLGHRFELADGTMSDGLGLLDVTSTLSDEDASGPVITRPNTALGLPAMSGYESHRGRTTLGSSAVPLAEVELGTGNGDGADGAVQGRVVGTYVHGPVLARNAELADLLLSYALGGVVLDPVPAEGSEALRAQRIGEDRDDPTGWAGREHGNPRLTLGRLLRR